MKLKVITPNITAIQNDPQNFKLFSSLMIFVFMLLQRKAISNPISKNGA